MIITARKVRFQRSMARQARGYTLVEILVVLFVLMLLAAIALPTVKDLLSNQKTSRAARNLTAFIDKVRSRAIAEQRPFGILIERGVGSNDPYGLSQSIRVRQIAGVPPYSGDASNAFATLFPHPSNPALAIAEFTVKDNQLLELSRRIYSEGSDVYQVPIRNGDYIELPGGRMVPVTIYPEPPQPYLTPPAEPMVRVAFSLTNLYPDGARDLTSNPRVKYRIHRHPVVSASTPFSMPRGGVIDMKFSGVGVAGNQFSSLVSDVNPSGGSEIIFGPDGSVQRVTKAASWETGSLEWIPAQEAALGSIFLCVGDSDGLWSEEDGLFSQDKKSLSNLLNLESIWVTVNPYTGRCNASEMAPVDPIPAVPVMDPNPDPTSSNSVVLRNALSQARLFATLSDSVDPE